MKKNTKFEIAIWIIILLPLAILPFFWDQLPDQVPGHWNYQNEVDQYYPKEIGMLLAPAINIVIYLMFRILPKIDPRWENYNLFKRSYNYLRLGLAVLMDIIFFVVLFYALDFNIHVGYIIIYTTLAFFLLIGNFMGNFRSNYFVGIRTPWTLNDPEVWKLTHRLSAKIWVISTVAMMILGFIIPFSIFTILYFVYIGVIVLVPIVYSYIIYKKFKKMPSISDSKE